MRVMRAGPLLAETRLDQFRPLGALGEPAYLAHARLVAALQGLGSADCARYFARPQPDGRGERLTWHAGMEGEVRPWARLSEEELRSATPRLLAIKQRLGDICAAREATDATDGFARLLRNACVAPGLEHLFLVDGQPVLTAWGFEAERPRFDTLQFVLPADEPQREAPMPIAARRDWSWLRRLWWLPLAVLLAAAVFWLLWRWWPAHPAGTGAEDRAVPKPELYSAPAGPQAPARASAAGAEPDREPVPSARPKPPPRSGEVLSIPDRGIDFLEGSWRTESALVDRRDGKPLVQTFTFDRNGWGEVVTRRSDGVECRGRARAYRTAEGKLVIYGIEQAACSDGDAFVPFRMECEAGEGGASECRGVNSDDGSGYGVLVRRL
jgi:hypothetical protein